MNRIRSIWGIALIALLAGTGLLIGCSHDDDSAGESGMAAGGTAHASGRGELDHIAEKYVKLVLALGEIDPDCIDSYFGPSEWRAQAKSEGLDLHEVATRVAMLQKEIEQTRAANPARDASRRLDFLVGQIDALESRIRIVRGETMSFDEELKVLFDIEPADCPVADYRTALDTLNFVLPGEGVLIERYEDYIADFYVRPELFESVFRQALQECRQRTKRYMDLPGGERVELDFVKGVSWTGYIEYVGGYRSVLHINTDKPFLIDRIVEYAAHEAYPGHQVQNILLDQYLLRASLRCEFYVIPTYSPLIALMEGCAEYGIRLVFPGDEFNLFVKSLFFDAGLDPDRADEYLLVHALLKKCLDMGGSSRQDKSCVSMMAIRRYADGEIGADQTIEWMKKYALVTPVKAKKALRFVDDYGSYFGLYDSGCRLIAEYMTAWQSDQTSITRRWELLQDLYTSPQLPSTLVLH